MVHPVKNPEKDGFAFLGERSEREKGIAVRDLDKNFTRL